MSRPQFTSPTNNTRISANGTVEVNADQSSDIEAGEASTTTILADAGEVWKLQAVSVDCPDLTAPGSDGDDHRVILRTQQQGVELLYGKTREDNRLTFESGVWTTSVSESRTSDLNIKIDDTNGIDAVYLLGSDANGTAFSDRRFRFAFSVVKA